MHAPLALVTGLVLLLAPGEAQPTIAPVPSESVVYQPAIASTCPSNTFGSLLNFTGSGLVYAAPNEALVRNCQPRLFEWPSGTSPSDVVSLQVTFGVRAGAATATSAQALAQTAISRVLAALTAVRMSCSEAAIARPPA